jgi:hypothetical protein
MMLSEAKCVDYKSFVPKITTEKLVEQNMNQVSFGFCGERKFMIGVFKNQWLLIFTGAMLTVFVCIVKRFNFENRVKKGRPSSR